MKWTERDGLSVFRQPASRANGGTTDLEDRLISCLTTGRSVVRLEHDWTLTTVADRYQGGRLTSPNDVVVKSDGSIWFTDPDYGFLCPVDFGHGDRPEQDRNRVYRVEPESGTITAVSEDFDKPNGLAFSPDESVLYVGDTGRTHGAFRPHQVIAFDVTENGTELANPRIFAVIEPWVPDGFRVVSMEIYISQQETGYRCSIPWARCWERFLRLRWQRTAPLGCPIIRSCLSGRPLRSGALN